MTVSADLPDLVRARLLRLLGGLIIPTGQVERGEAGFREALEIFRAHGDEMSVVDLRARLVMRVGSDGDPDEARRLVAEVRATNEVVGNPLVEPLLLTTLGEAERREGNLEGAREHFRRSADLAKERGFVLWNLWQLLSLVDVELQLDMLEDAERSGRRASLSPVASRTIGSRRGSSRISRSLLSSATTTGVRGCCGAPWSRRRRRRGRSGRTTLAPRHL